jgi:hypothetical protein
MIHLFLRLWRHILYLTEKDCLVELALPVKVVFGLIGRLSFQSIFNANEFLKDLFGIEILNGFVGDDLIFLNKMFNRRHLVIHTGGRVDDKYLKNTNDTSVRLNQVIRVENNDIRRLIPLTTLAGKNLIEGFESMQ